MRRIPVTILTGFLGAGKTTLLNRLIAEPGFERTAVVVNEFGEAGVDGALVAQADERAFAMSVGCLCCTVSGDVRLTLLRLLDDAASGQGPDFDRIVIETTGLADPMPLLQTFMTSDLMLDRFALNGIVTLVDAVNGMDALVRFGEAQRQAAVADAIILTKGDLARDPASRRDLDALTNRLRATAPNASIVTVEEATAATIFSHAAFDPAGKPPDVRDWLRFEGHADHAHTHNGHGHHHPHAHDVNRHGDTASAYCFSGTGPIDAGRLENAIAALQRSLGRDLLRMKGLIEIEGHPDQPRLLHVVGHLTNPPRLLDPWPIGVGDTRLVMIVAGPGREAAAQMLTRFLPQLCRFRATMSRTTEPAEP